MSQPLRVFLYLAFGGSLLLSLAIGLAGSLSFLAPLSMLIPTLAVAATRSLTGDSVRIEWDCLPARWLPLSLLALPLAIHAVALPGVVLLEGRMPWAIPPQFGWGPLSGPALAFRIAINAMVGLAVVSMMAFFEEVGWRAFLLPRLAQRWGAPRAALTGASLWALWHVPYALAGVHHAEHVSPSAMALVDIVGGFGAGLFLAFLWFRTKSIVLVSLAHGSLNNWGQYAFKFMGTSGEKDATLLGFVAAGMLAAGLIAYSRVRASE